MVWAKPTKLFIRVVTSWRRKWQPTPAFLGLGGSNGKVSACNVGDPGSIPGLGRCPWRRQWQPTPVLLPGKSHGQRSLIGSSPWGCKESDMTEGFFFHFPVFLPRESHGQRSLAGYSQWVCKESDITESTEQAHVTSAQPHQPVTLLQSLE